MKRIGLIGGLSWESSAEYYRLLNVGVRERLGGLHSADLVLRSVDFAEYEEFFRLDNWDDAASGLSSAAVELERAGVDLILLCTNTAHKVADPVAKAVDVDFLHIVDVVGAAADRIGASKLGLLGTSFTMTEPFYREGLQRQGFDVVIPEEADREVVHSVIFRELCLGVVDDGSRSQFREIIDRLVDRGSDAIILGCTELELLVKESDSPVPLLATTRLHVDAALDRALRPESR